MSSNNTQPFSLTVSSHRNSSSGFNPSDIIYETTHNTNHYDFITSSQILYANFAGVEEKVPV